MSTGARALVEELDEQVVVEIGQDARDASDVTRGATGRERGAVR